jgi:hypothetical protein
MRPRNARDFFAGCLFLTFGLAFLIFAQDIQLGSARRMGPGYFPLVLSLLLVAIGAAVMVRAFLAAGPGIGDVAGRAMLLVTVAVVLFGLLVRDAGLAAATAVLVLVSALASRQVRWLQTVALAVALAAFCVLVFVKGLGLPFPMLGTWLGG